MDLPIHERLVYSGSLRFKFADDSHVEELEKLISEYSQRLGIPIPLSQTTSDLQTTGKEGKKRSPENRSRTASADPSSPDSSQAV